MRTPRIAHVEARPLRGTVREDVAIVSSLGAHKVGSYVLVVITADNGVRGHGEATVTAVWSGETQPGAIALVEQVARPILLDVDPFDLAWIEARLASAIHGNSFVRSAIETALWDLQARLLNVPLSQLLGGSKGADGGIRLKFVIGAAPPEIAAERAAKLVHAGWNAIKVKVGTTGRALDDVERIHAVRRAVGADVWLSVDANGAFPPSEAIWLSKQLERLDVALFEQPTRRGQHDQMRRVRDRSGIPIMADESVFSLDDARTLLGQEAADVLSLYPGKHGGLRETLAIARLAQAAGVACTMGSNLERECATAAMAHLVAASPAIDTERIPGDLIGPLYFTEHASERPLVYQADRLQLPVGCGIGVDVASDPS